MQCNAAWRLVFFFRCPLCGPSTSKLMVIDPRLVEESRPQFMIVFPGKSWFFSGRLFCWKAPSCLFVKFSIWQRDIFPSPKRTCIEIAEAFCTASIGASKVHTALILTFSHGCNHIPKYRRPWSWYLSRLCMKQGHSSIFQSNGNELNERFSFCRWMGFPLDLKIIVTNPLYKHVDASRHITRYTLGPEIGACPMICALRPPPQQVLCSALPRLCLLPMQVSVRLKPGIPVSQRNPARLWMKHFG